MPAEEKRSLLTRISEPERVPVGKQGQKITKAWYECECEDKTRKFLPCGDVKNLVVVSCGCISRKKASERFKKYNEKVGHGLSTHPLYQIWGSIKNKTHCPNAKNYEQVPFESSWEEFIPFYEWAIDKWKDGLSISRIAAEKGYVSDNCYFCTLSEVNTPYKHEKSKATSLKNYGVDNPMKSKEVKDKAEATCMERYGVKNSLANPEIKARARQTCLELYGSIHVTQNPEIMARIEATNMERYGVKSTCQHPATRAKQIATCIKNNGTARPKPNGTAQNDVRLWLESFGDKWPSNSNILGHREIDLFCIEKSFGIEYSGVFWHSDILSKINKLNHYNKYKDCLDKGIRLINIFSDEWVHRNAQVKNHLKRELGYCSTKISAQDCEINRLDKITALKFYNDNSIKPISKLQIAYGIFNKENKLVGCFIFFKSTQNNHIRLLRPVYVDDAVIDNPEWLFAQIPHNANLPIVAKTDNRWDSTWPERDFNFVFKEDINPQFKYVANNNKELRFTEPPVDKRIGKIYNAGRKTWLLTPQV